MTDADTLRSDLAFMRAMADDGRSPSPQGGAILAAGGFIFGLASFAAWAVLSGLAPGGVQAVWLPWGAAMLVFAPVLVLCLRSIGREGGSAPASGVSAIAGRAWSAMGGAMFTLIVAAMAANVVTGSPAVWALIPSVFTALYGAGWAVACAASGRGWMRGLALASFAASVVLACLAASPAVYLAYGAALMLLGGVPGLVLARARPVAPLRA